MVSFQVNDTAMAESSPPQRNSGMRIGLLGAGGLAQESGIPFVPGREALCSVGGPPLGAWLACYSALAALRELASPVRYGT